MLIKMQYSASPKFVAPQALFLLTESEDIELASIAGKITVDYVVRARGVIAESQSKDVNHFFYQFHYEPSTNKIADASMHESQPKDCDNRRRQCHYCDNKEKSDQFQTHLPISGVLHDGPLTSFQWKGSKFYLNDFVYFSQVERKLSDLGQIQEMSMTT